MRRALFLLATASLATAAIAWQQTVNQLQQDGKTISTNLRVVDGTLMVPVKDVAGYLGGTLSVANGTATISGSGVSTTSASPTLPGLGGLASATPTFMPEAKRPEPVERSGKVGDIVDNGGFGLTVVGIDDLPKGSYKSQYDPRGRRVSPSAGDERLVVVRMRLENGTSETRRPPLPYSADITLFDEKGVGIPATAIDSRPIDMSYDDLGGDFPRGFEAPILAPKGAFEFAVVFSLPKDRTPKSLAVALPPATGDAGGTNVRIGF